MDNFLLIVSSLGGALIGATASIATSWVQARTQSNRERLRFVADFALQDYKLNIELVNKSGRSYACPPIAAFLHYHLGLNKLVESGDFSEEAYKKLVSENRAFLKSIKGLQE